MNQFVLLHLSSKPKEMSKSYEDLEHIIFIIIFATFSLKVKSWIFSFISFYFKNSHIHILI